MKTVLISILLFLLVSGSLPAQETDSTLRDIFLKVVDKKNRPVNSVMVQTSTSGKIGLTNNEGLYLFKEMSDIDSIMISLPKYRTLIVPVAGMDSIVVRMRSAHRLEYFDAVKNPNYDREKLEPNEIVDAQTIVKQSNARNLYELLAGRVAGLNVQEGGATSIRGQNSINLSSEPLVIVNGIRVGTLSEANSFVDVKDVKTIEVLKSGAGYGIQGANGVIIIKTK